MAEANGRGLTMPSMPETGMQQFLRIAGLFGPQDDTNAYEGMPSELPTPLINRQPNAGISMPNAYGDEAEQGFNPRAMGEEDPESSTLNAFRQNVLNPPKRTQMTYPKNTLAGLHKALEIAAEPSPLEKNRVWVNGKAHQKQSVRTDPVTGEKQYITNVHEPSFGSQVMRAMPASISAATDILNQPREDAVSDWELKNKGLKEAIGAESQMALAGKRGAEAGAIPRKLDQGDRALDIREMDATTRDRVSRLKDLPDSEKLRLLQEGKITMQELNSAAAMSRLERGGEIRSGQITQQGNIRAGQIAQQGDESRKTVAARGGIQKELARIRGEEARTTKQTPGAAGSAGSSETQQKVGLQNRTAQVLSQNPEWEDYVTFDDNGFPKIESPNAGGWFGSGPDKETYDKIYEGIYGAGRAAPVPPKGKPTTVTTPPKPSAKPNTAQPVPVPPPMTPGIQPIIQSSASTGQYRISYDGGKTWRPYNPNGKQ